MHDYHSYRELSTGLSRECQMRDVMSRLLLSKLYREHWNSRLWNWKTRGTCQCKVRVSKQSYGSGCRDSPPVRTRIALPVDYDRVVDFMSKTYFKTEPSLVNIGLACLDEPPPPLLHLMRENVKEGMTIIAEGADNCVVGAAVNASTCSWHSERIVEYAECCCEPGSVRDIVKFYAYVMREPKLWDKYCVPKVFECCYVGVDSRYLGMGMGRRLVRESWYLARDCGYQVFRMDCTSRYTARIAEGFGWECVFTMPYRRYIDRGGLVFTNVQEPHTELRVFVDQPLICKDYCLTNPDKCKMGTVPRDK